jgi:hypothetical protein
VADAAPAGAEAVFFPVGLLKLTLMSLATLGLYEIYWFYKNWKCVQHNFGDKLNAPIRALFYTLTSYWLFKKVREQAREAQLDGRLRAGPLALSVLLIGALGRLPDPWWLLSLLGFLPLLPVQSMVNELNRKLSPQAGTNSGFSGWNIVALILFGIVLILGVIGTFFGE